MRSKLWYVGLIVVVILGVAAAAWRTLPSQVQADSKMSIVSAALDNSVETAVNRSPVVLVQESAEINPVGASQSAESEVAPSLDIENDVVEILNVVRGFAQKEETNFLGQEGWIQISTQEYMPTEMRGNGSPELPMNQLYPEDNSFPENWYHVDKTGIYYESLALTFSADGTITQKSIFANGRIVNLTARAAGFANGEYDSVQSPTKVSLPASGALYMLEQMQSWPGTLSAKLTDNQYVVTYERLYEEVLVNPITQQPAIGEKTIYTFDGNTGQLLSREFQALHGEGWVVMHKLTYLTVEFTTVLPTDIDQLFNDALSSSKEG